MLAASGTREIEYPKPKGMLNAKFSAFSTTTPVDTDKKAANFGHAGAVHQLIAAVPADKQKAYILQVDDTGKLSAREYAGQLGQHNSVRQHIREELDKELDHLTPKISNAKK